MDTEIELEGEEKTVKKRLSTLNAGILLAVIVLLIHCASESLFIAMLITILIGSFFATALYCGLYVLLLAKNRSFWHPAITDRDPVVWKSIKLFAFLLLLVHVFVVYRVVLS